MAAMRIVLLLSCALILTACAARPLPWQHPTLPKEDWSADWTACKRWADTQVGYQEGDSSSPFDDYDRSRAKRQVDSYAGSCMRERGYVPVRRR